MLKEKFQEMSKDALRNRDTETRKILGNILAEFLKVEKAGGFTGWVQSAEEDVIRSYIKSLTKSLEGLKGTPIAEDYQREINFLAGYLPQTLSEDETRALVATYAAGAKSSGALMGAIMKDHRGKVNPELVKKLVGELGLK